MSNHRYPSAAGPLAASLLLLAASSLAWSQDGEPPASPQDPVQETPQDPVPPEPPAPESEGDVEAELEQHPEDSFGGGPEGDASGLDGREGVRPMRPESEIPVSEAQGVIERDAQVGTTRNSERLTISEEDGVPLSMEEAAQLAIQNNLSIQIELVATDIAQANYIGAWGAFDPVFGASLNYEDSKLKLGQGNDIFALERRSKVLTGGLSLSQPLTTGGSIDVSLDSGQGSGTSSFDPDASYDEKTGQFSVAFNQPLLRGAWNKYATVDQREARFDLMKQQEKLRQSRQELLIQVVNAYWELVASRGARAVSVEALSLAEEQMEQNQRRLEVGVGTEVDVLQAETEVATRQEELLLARKNVRQAEDALKDLIFYRGESEGLDQYLAWWERPILPTTELPAVEQDARFDWTRSLSSALQRRSELIQQRFEIQAQDVNLVRAESARRPALDFVAQASGQGLDTGAIQDAAVEAVGFEYPTASVGLVYSQNLRNRTALQQERAARHMIRMARMQYDLVERQVLSEVRSTVREVIYLGEAVAAAQKSVDLAERQLAAEQARFQEGLSTTFQVFQFQKTLSDTRFALTRARANYAKARGQLLKAEGVLGETREE